MSKPRKIYKLNVPDVKSFNIGRFNPTCRAIIKSLYLMAKDDPEFKGATGEQVLQYAKDHELWNTKQSPENYASTWNYYAKELKRSAHVEECGTVQNTAEEYLE